MGVEANRFGNPGGEIGKSTRCEDANRTMGFHRLNRAAPARCQLDPFPECSLECILMKAGKARNARREGRLKIKLAAHSLFSDRGNLVLNAGKVGKFIDTFLLDNS